MRANKYLVLIVLGFVFAQAYGQQEALVLSPIELLADSSFSAESLGNLAKGKIVEIIGQSKQLHEDKTQTQQFHWYHIKDETNAEGWVMGDELAMLRLSPSKYVGLEQLTGTSYNIGDGFEQSVFYWGEVVGKDDVSSHFSAKNEYHENYLVFVNPKNEVIHLPAGTQSERGDNICKGIYFADLTGDHNQEIVLYRSLSGKEMDEEVRTVEIYQLVEHQFQLIFEQRLNLDFALFVPSPARFKFIDISPDGIRIEYPKYTDFDSKHFGESIKKQKVSYQKNLSWVSESFTWDAVNHKFNHFYFPSSLPLRAKIKKDATYLREEPNIRSTSIQVLKIGARLKVLAHLENITKIKGKKTTRVFFLVKTNSGTLGYLPSDQITFIKTQHAKILNAFYASPMLVKEDWDGEMEFVRLRDFSKEAHWEVTGNFSSDK